MTEHEGGFWGNCDVENLGRAVNDRAKVLRLIKFKFVDGAKAITKWR